MADRKVLLKYIPKNFNPKLLVKRGRGRDKLMMVRNMLPMSLRCDVCANYLYIGTKFNMRMQICNEQTYLGIKTFRFYLKCTYCYNDICFKTDPKNHDYIVEQGGTRNYEPIKDAEQAQKLMKKMRKEEKEGNSMKFLQTRTYDSKREMELMEALDDIKNLNKRHALIDPEDLLNNMFVEEEENEKFTEEEEREIEERFRMLRKRKLGEGVEDNNNYNVQEIKEEKEEEDCQGEVKREGQGVVEEKEGQGEGKEKEKEEEFNPRMHALMKGGLFSKQEKQDEGSVVKKGLPKMKKIIKKAVIPQKEKEKQQKQAQKEQKQLCEGQKENKDAA